METRIVSAHGTAVKSRDPILRVLLEAAMLAAAQDAISQGITDPDVIREKVLAAREKVRAERYGLTVNTEEGST
jgi:hypothetical protein